LMRTTPPTPRYVRINVRDSLGKIKAHLAHVWVLEAFVGARPKGAIARHLNDDPTDNRLENLMWGTRTENAQDAVINGRRRLRETCPLGHPISGENIQMTGHASARCKACNRARANAHWHNKPFTKEDADRYFEEVMQ
jgi:HNH endonuclease